MKIDRADLRTPSACYAAGARMRRSCFDVAPSAFVPPPKVTSSVVHITSARGHPRLAISPMLEKVTQAAFGQRRKMLRQSLKGIHPDPVALLTPLGIAPTARAEELGVADFSVRSPTRWPGRAEIQVLFREQVFDKSRQGRDGARAAAAPNRGWRAIRRRYAADRR